MTIVLAPPKSRQVGLSRRCIEDCAQREAGMALYGAFFRRSKKATDAPHNWPANPVSRPAPRKHIWEKAA